MRRTTFLRFWLTTLLPLSWLLVHGVTAAWRRRVHVSGWDGQEGTFTQYGFPLAYQMDYPYTSAAWHWFLGPLLLDWAVYLLTLTGLAWVVWPRLRALPLRPLMVSLWVLFVPLLGLTTLDFLLSYVSWTSPYPVLAEQAVRVHVGWVRP